MPEKNLKQPGFAYNACGRIFKETENSRYVYQNELDKACFKACLKDLTRRAASDKILHDKLFNIAKNPKCGAY